MICGKRSSVTTLPELPADRPSRRQWSRRRRSLIAMAASPARARPAQRVHLRREKHRLDHPSWHLGPANRCPPGDAMARGQASLGQHVDAPATRRQPGRRGPGNPGGNRPGPRPPGAGDHRDDAGSRPGVGSRSARASQGPGYPPRARRFRHRLLVPGLLAALPACSTSRSTCSKSTRCSPTAWPAKASRSTSPWP